VNTVRFAVDLRRSLVRQILNEAAIVSDERFYLIAVAVVGDRPVAWTRGRGPRSRRLDMHGARFAHPATDFMAVVSASQRASRQ
jgi:hypothetical protein